MHMNYLGKKFNWIIITGTTKGLFITWTVYVSKPILILFKSSKEFTTWYVNDCKNKTEKYLGKIFC